MARLKLYYPTDEMKNLSKIFTRYMQMADEWAVREYANRPEHIKNMVKIKLNRVPHYVTHREIYGRERW